MTTDTTAAPHATPADEHDALRAQHYRLLARFMAEAPGADLLHAAAELRGAPGDFGDALNELATQARLTTVEGAAREYHKLFVGMPRGELLPYASFYRTGFLHERPLAEIRTDMAALGLARADGRSEPEDHIACLCDVMAGLLEGSVAPVGQISAETFFTRHVAPWADLFFHNLRTARSAGLYRPIGTLGQHLMALETAAYRFAA